MAVVHSFLVALCLSGLRLEGLVVEGESVKDVQQDCILPPTAGAQTAK